MNKSKDQKNPYRSLKTGKIAAENTSKDKVRSTKTVSSGDLRAGK